LKTYIGNTLDALTLELAAIELLNSRLQVCGGLEFNKSVQNVSGPASAMFSSDNPPSSIAVSASLRIDDVKAGLTCKVFEVLCQNPSKW
jgi:hypothetical protein